MSTEDTSAMPSMIPRQDLLARPGWTAGRIEKLLGGPDEIEAVHTRRRDYLMYFYSAEHVRHVEATPEFVIARDKLEARRAARARAAQEQQLAEQRRILAEAERTDVLAALFTLNRIAKWYRDERLYDAMEEIYAKKGQVIAHMLDAGRLTVTDTHRIGGVYAEVLVGEGYRFHRPCAPPEETADIKEMGLRGNLWA